MWGYECDYSSSYNVMVCVGLWPWLLFLLLLYCIMVSVGLWMWLLLIIQCNGLCGLWMWLLLIIQCNGLCGAMNRIAIMVSVGLWMWLFLSSQCTGLWGHVIVLLIICCKGLWGLFMLRHFLSQNNTFVCSDLLIMVQCDSSCGYECDLSSHTV